MLKRAVFLLSVILLLPILANAQPLPKALSFAPGAQQAKKQEKNLRFTHIDKLRETKPKEPRYFMHKKVEGLLPVQLPIDWAKNFSFPMHGNDRYGDCYYAAAVHADETYTANLGQQFLFDDRAIITAYLRLSGGDNGLTDQDIQEEWKFRGLAGVPDAKILDALYIKVTDPSAVQTALQNCMVVMFTLAVPNTWINDSDTGSVWDAPARANPANGHAVMFNGCDEKGRYKCQTWGTYVWLTPAGVNVCDPDGWVVFTARAFSKQTGRAPNGLHIADAAKLWVAAGGKTIPQSVIDSFPPVTPTPPPPTPTPDPPTPPSPGSAESITITIGGNTYQRKLVAVDAIVITPNMTIAELFAAMKMAHDRSETKPAPKLNSDPRIDALEQANARTQERLLQVLEAMGQLQATLEKTLPAKQTDKN